MTDIVMSKLFKPIGYNFESTWGTDPGGTRLGFLGAMGSAKFNYKKNKKAFKEVGGTVDPSTFVEGKKEYRLDIEIPYLKNDLPANSLLGWALGSVPTAGGVITNYPTSSYTNVRSATVELGYDWSGTDQYWVVPGCVVERLEYRWKAGNISAKLGLIPKTYTRSATPGTLPSLSTLGTIWSCTVAFTNPTVSNQLVTEAAIIIENKFETESVTTTGQEIGIAQIIDRRVLCELDIKYTSNDWWTQFEADPAAAAADVDIAITWAKNSNAEYIYAALTNCQIVSDIDLETTGDGKLLGNKFVFEAKTSAFDDVV